MHKRARSSGPIGAGAGPGGFPPASFLSPSQQHLQASSSPFPPAVTAGIAPPPPPPQLAAAAPISGVARVAAKLLELDAAAGAVRAEEQKDLEALQRRKLIEEVGNKAAEVEGLRARLATVQARKVGSCWGGVGLGWWEVVLE